MLARRAFVDTSALNAALRDIEDAIAYNERLREHILGIMQLAGQAPRATRGRPRQSGGSSAVARQAGGKRRGGSGRRPPGEKSLKDYVGEVLQKVGQPVRPRDLTKLVLQAGYETSAKPESFYTAVFTAARAHPDVVNTENGFLYKPGAGGGTTKKGKAAKRGRKKRAKKA